MTLESINVQLSRYPTDRLYYTCTSLRYWNHAKNRFNVRITEGLSTTSITKSFGKLSPTNLPIPVICSLEMVL
jgi:hypothetical protein